MSGRKPHRVVGLTYPDGQILDIVGPLEVFSRTARWLRDKGYLRDNAYEVEVVAPQSGPVRMSSGIELIAKRSYKNVRRIDTLFVAGGIGCSAASADEDLVRWIRRQSGRVQRVASVCTGALLLAKAGVLNGHKATTHWAYCDILAHDYPRVDVDEDAIFVREGNLYTSAGVTAGMDLALALIEEDWGREAALAVAQELVMFMKRPGGQSQFSSMMSAQHCSATRFKDLLLWIQKHLGEDLSVESLAGKLAMSPRNFARSFVRETGETPAKHIQRVRLEAARRELEEHRGSAEQIAASCGFGTAETMRRTFIRHLRVSPNEYRNRFRSTANA